MTEDYSDREKWPDKKLRNLYAFFVSTPIMDADEREEFEAVGDEILRRMKEEEGD